jgi:hypothetical protein
MPRYWYGNDNFYFRLGFCATETRECLCLYANQNVPSTISVIIPRVMMRKPVRFISNLSLLIHCQSRKVTHEKQEENGRK